MPSDIQAVSQWAYHNQDAGRVPYGTVFLDDDEIQGAADGRSFESLGDVYASVDWRGLDSGPDDSVGDPASRDAAKPTVAKRGPGRPKKVNSDG